MKISTKFALWALSFGALILLTPACGGEKESKPADSTATKQDPPPVAKTSLTGTYEWRTQNGEFETYLILEVHDKGGDIKMAVSGGADMSQAYLRGHATKVADNKYELHSTEDDIDCTLTIAFNGDEAVIDVSPKSTNCLMGVGAPISGKVKRVNSAVPAFENMWDPGNNEF